MVARELVEMLPIYVGPMPVQFDLHPAAFIANLHTGEVIYRQRDRSRRPRGIVMMTQQVAVHPAMMVDSVLLARTETGQLGSALRRSTHWQALARDADDDADALLMLWMAAETLGRGIDDDGGLTARFVSALGFPRGPYARDLPPNVRQMFGDDVLRSYANEIVRLVERLRIVRNAIAHTGFRALELPTHLNEDELERARTVMTRLVPRLQLLAVSALRLGHTEIERLWENFATVFLHEAAGEEPTRTARWIISLLEDDDPW